MSLVQELAGICYAKFMQEFLIKQVKGTFGHFTKSLVATSNWVTWLINK